MEIYHELVLLFLELAKKYEDKGVGFHRYIYYCYRYHIIKFIDSKLDYHPDEETARYKDAMHRDYSIPSKEDAVEFKVWENKSSWDNMPTLDADDHEDLNNMLWQEGIICSPLFKDMSLRDRFILVRHYQDGFTDKEVAVQTGMHHRSVYRARKRLTEELHEKIKRENEHGTNES
jgi:RNA polymerase sigma factor (sigma-70 family)